jgi:hypothetical protein
MPKPMKGESKNEYMGRCISMVIKEGTAQSQDQAIAICFSMWKQHGKKKKGR